jgi:hypothetical protein
MLFRSIVSEGRWGTSGQHFSLLNIIQSFNLKFKFYIVFESWTEKLNFSTVANILKIIVLGFFAILNLFP